MKRILLLSLAIGFLIFQLTSSADAQEKLRIVREAALKGSPVIIVSRQVGNKLFDRSVENRHGIVAGEDWIEQLAFDVKNVSNKNIAFISLELAIPKSGKMEHNGRIVLFVFGKRAASAATLSKNPSIPIELLKPSEMVKLKTSELERANLATYLKKYDVREVENVTIDIRQVHFEDGTGWNLGVELRQDPVAPQRWNPVNREQSKNGFLPSSFLITSILPPKLSDFYPQLFAFPIPAPCRNFFASTKVVSPDPPECGYYGGPEDRVPCQGGCVLTIDTNGCDQPDDESIGVFSTTGQYGYILPSQSVSCRPIDTPGNQASCTSCEGGVFDKFELDSLCGQPHGCSQRADWGCVPPLVNVNGFC